MRPDNEEAKGTSASGASLGIGDALGRGHSVAEAGKALNAETITCHSCEREVPNGSIYCPHCCGEDGREGAIKRGGFVGGMLGLMAGGILAAVWSSIVGPERGTWGMVFGITMGSVVTGVLLGMIRQRKE